MLASKRRIAWTIAVAVLGAVPVLTIAFFWAEAADIDTTCRWASAADRDRIATVTLNEVLGTPSKRYAEPRCDSFFYYGGIRYDPPVSIDHVTEHADGAGWHVIGDRPSGQRCLRLPQPGWERIELKLYPTSDGGVRFAEISIAQDNEACDGFR